ncbi:tetratricopeptide repeat protein [Denitratisoma oestradiolicum]|uniref:protein O-GlcNAc transferase n=1 Tax=Denitratisoma oestradiolicum TaxID=311182 RepID=A0A6S6Y136_9PROT|nr:tetratricopeptide repeat protein [Denitratisoma oestradiolicum]TWO78847.1 hypothetical protein CBW56_17830 [Denitratisoma oestradiolicum]CAB1370501.1 protein of unknown function [Denitratisoma oestradiolicum]
MKNTQLKKAEIAYKQKEYAKAEAVCRALLEEHPRQYSTLIVLANTLLMQHRFDEAESTCQKILELSPDHPRALNQLAVIYLERDRNRRGAIDCLSRAVAVEADDWEALANLGQLYIEEGMFAEGTDLLERSLRINPKNFSVHNGLGMLEKERGRPNLAVNHFRRALKLRPANQAVRNNLASCGGQALLKVELGAGHKSPEFMAAYQLAGRGEYQAAAQQFLALLEQDPNNLDIIAALAKAYLAMGDFAEALKVSDRLVQLAPDWSETHNIRGFLLGSTGGDINDIVAHFKRAAELARDDWQALINLGHLALDQESLEDAMGYFERALEISPGNIKALNGLAYIHTMRLDYGSAADLYSQMFEATPDNPVIATNLITALSKAERRDDAYQICRRYLEIENPDVTVFSVYSSARHGCLWDISKQLLPKMRAQMERTEAGLATYFVGANLGLMSEPDFSNEDLLTFHKKIGAQTSITTRPPTRAPHTKATTPRKRLRIGYLSADFNAHSVSFFFHNLFREHDPDRFEIYLYSNTAIAREDNITALYRKLAEKFLCIYGLTDEQVADRIEADGINVLVDMGGYTDRSRLAVLAYRPAPVQLSYLGYPATTGMPEVDYVLADPYLNGPENARYFTEKLLELPESFLCFGHLRLRDIANEMPLDQNGFITFGSLTNPYKLNERTLDVWCQVMHAIPDSRFYLNHPRFDWKMAIDRVTQAFVERGIDAERLTIESRRDPSGSHLGLYAHMDLSLDTMPLTGGTTTVDALSMGIPVVTRAGEVFHQRISYSVIKNIGLDVDELVSFDDREFVAKAIALASNPERIRHFRTNIPTALRSGILCDTVRFTRQLEDAYLNAWQNLCPDHPLAEFVKADDETGQQKRQYGLVSISTAPSTDDLFHYVLQERGQWYENEVHYFAEIADLFPLVWDIGDDPGVYAIPIAIAQLPSGGSTTAIRIDSDVRQLLERSSRANNLPNLKITGEADLAARPDLIRLAFMEENDSLAWMEQHWSILKEGNPAILLQPPPGTAGISAGALVRMAEYGLTAFHLVPGIGTLVGLAADKPVPATPLLFCKGDKRKRLTTAGLLCDTVPGIEKMATSQSADWWTIIGRQPGLSLKMLEWLGAPKSSSEHGDHYMMALNNLNGCHQDSVSLLQRLQLLRFVKGILVGVVNMEPSVPRVLTLIRVLVDSGEDEPAIQLAVSLAEQLAGHSGSVLDEPFLHPFPEWRRLAPAPDEAQWAFSLCLATAERLRHPTTFFSPEDSLPIWQKLVEYPWFATEAARVLRLIGTRLSAT